MWPGALKKNDSQNAGTQGALERAYSVLDQHNPLEAQIGGTPARAQAWFPGWSVVVQSGDEGCLGMRGLHWTFRGYFSADQVTHEKSVVVEVETKLSIRKYYPDARGTEADVNSNDWELVRCFDTELTFENEDVSEALNNFQNDLCRARAMLGDKSAAASTAMSGHQI